MHVYRERARLLRNSRILACLANARRDPACAHDRVRGSFAIANAGRESRWLSSYVISFECRAHCRDEQRPASTNSRDKSCERIRVSRKMGKRGDDEDCRFFFTRWIYKGSARGRILLRSFATKNARHHCVHRTDFILRNSEKV